MTKSAHLANDVIKKTTTYVHNSTDRTCGWFIGEHSSVAHFFQFYNYLVDQKHSSM